MKFVCPGCGLVQDNDKPESCKFCGVEGEDFKKLKRRFYMQYKDGDHVDADEREEKIE